MESLDQLLDAIAACRNCEAHLPLGPRPVVQLGSGARILMIGQAPGTRVHTTGVPWNDQSGERLRRWLAMDRQVFYDTSIMANMPMGLCYPGRGKGGDLPPRTECAPLWHERILAQLPQRRLTLLIGAYGIAQYLPKALRRATLAETVHAQLEAGMIGDVIALPHPSPRNIRWFQKHAWFEAECVPLLQARVRHLLDSGKEKPPLSLDKEG